MSTQQTYEQRVHRIAEEMATEQYNRGRMVGRSYWDGLAESTKRQKINTFLAAASIAVKHMAELAKNILSITTDYNGEALQEELRFRGLIPEQEAENYGTI